MTTIKQLWNGVAWKARLLFEPRDFWIGLYWKETELCMHFYLCICPMFPIHVVVLKRYFRRVPSVRNSDWTRKIQ